MKKVDTEDKTSIALINNNIGFIQSDIKDIKLSIKELGGVFATKVETSEINKIQIDHENRIRTGEQSMWKYLGAYSVITVVVTIVLPIILKLFVK